MNIQFHESLKDIQNKSLIFYFGDLNQVIIQKGNIDIIICYTEILNSQKNVKKIQNPFKLSEFIKEISITKLLNEKTILISKRILIVDDNIIICKSLTHLLKKWEFTQ